MQESTCPMCRRDWAIMRFLQCLEQLRHLTGGVDEWHSHGAMFCQLNVRTRVGYRSRIRYIILCIMRLQLSMRPVCLHESVTAF